jgi:hydrocephalus-inducing protein
VKRKAFLDISPMIGKIAGGQKQKLTIKVCPTMPDLFEEQFDIQMGYFDPETIRIKGEGVYPSLVCQLPREEGNNF